MQVGGVRSEAGRGGGRMVVQQPERAEMHARVLCVWSCCQGALGLGRPCLAPLEPGHVSFPVYLQLV
jgi:hypothetical protein